MALIVVAFLVSLPSAAFARAPAPSEDETPVPPIETPAVEPTVGQAEAVIAAARAYLGRPYKLGREGPDLFDCSGLVFRAFADVGQLSLIGGSRRRAIGYQRWFTERGRFTTEAEEVERGDLVMYGHGSHIGIYLGAGKALSAILSGVTIHGLHGLTVPVTGFLKVDWSGAEPGTAMPDGGTGADVPEVPAELIPPLAWFSSSPLDAADEEPPMGVERTDMRTANSRTFEDDSGRLTTEFFSRPVFYQPAGSNEWQPIDLRFNLSEEGEGARLDTAPVALVLGASDDKSGFIRLEAGEHAVHLHVPSWAARRRSAARPQIGHDGRYADYQALLRGGIGMRVYPRADGFSSYLVFAKRPRVAELSFLFDAPGLSLAQDADGGLSMLDADGSAVGRIARPLTFDSSDVDGSGGGVAPSAATLGVSDDGDQQLLTLTLDERFLDEAVYPVFLDLTIADFPAPPDAGAAAFVTSAFPETSFASYQRPEWPPYRELWIGRQPGTKHHSEAFLRFAGVHEALVGVDVAEATLRLYPYWQHVVDAEPTSVVRVAEGWDASTLTWDSRPPSDLELGALLGGPGEWSQLDLTDHIRGVADGTVADHGLLVHASDAGKRGWKRVIAEGGQDDARLDARLVVTWSGLRPVPLDPDVGDGAGHLRWVHPTLAPPQTRFRVQVSADRFITMALGSGIVKGEAGEQTSWTMAPGVLEHDVEYQWRVKVRYGDAPWSRWSAPGSFQYPAANAVACSLADGLGPDATGAPCAH